MTGAANNEHDQAVPLELVPRPSFDEPEPFVVGTELQLALAYRISNEDLAAYGTSFDDEAAFCVLLFPTPFSHAHTNEDFHAHPLASNGLAEHSVHEVMNSSSVAVSDHAESAALNERHFVISFRDSTFECIASDCVVAGVYGSSDVAAREAFMLCK